MEAEIKIYQSCWKNLWLILGCMLFTVGGIYMITDESCRLVNKIIGGWLGVIFFWRRRIVVGCHHSLQCRQAHTVFSHL